MTFLHLSLIWLSFAAAVLALPVLYVYLSPATRGLGEHARLRAALAEASISGVISIPLGDEEVQQEESNVRGLIAAELIEPAFKAGVRGNVLMEALTRNSSLLQRYYTPSTGRHRAHVTLQLLPPDPPSSGWSRKDILRAILLLVACIGAFIAALYYLNKYQVIAIDHKDFRAFLMAAWYFVFMGLGMAGEVSLKKNGWKDFNPWLLKVPLIVAIPLFVPVWEYLAIVDKFTVTGSAMAFSHGMAWKMAFPFESTLGKLGK